jgi:hypothetical protein
MRRRLVAMLLAGLVLAGSGLSGAAAMKKQRPLRSTVLPLPRDGEAAARQELEVARRAGTRAAYDLFLSRHGDHPLAATARRERARLTH